MGVVYKIKPEIIKFILEQKEENPRLSCRGMIEIVRKRFNITLSKSSINAIMKEAGLSSSVGRRRRHPAKPKIITPETPQETKVPVEEKPMFLPKEKEEAPELLEQKPEEKPPIELPAAPELSAEEKAEPIELPAPKEPVKAQKQPSAETPAKPEEIKEKPSVELPAKPEGIKEEKKPPIEVPPKPTEVTKERLPIEEPTKPEVPKEEEKPAVVPSKPEAVEEEKPPAELPAKPEEAKKKPPEKPPAVPKEEEGKPAIPPKKEPEKPPVVPPKEPEKPLLVVPEKEIEKPKITPKEEPKKEPEKPPVAPVPEAPVPTLAKEEVKKEIPVEKKEEKPEVRLDIKLEPVEIKEVERLDNLGCFFLKAAEWEVGCLDYFSNSLKKVMPQLSAERAQERAKILLYLPLFNLVSLEDAQEYNNKGLWGLNQLTKKEPWPIFFEFIQGLGKATDLSLTVSKELGDAFAEVNFLGINLLDGKTFYIDGRFKNIWYDTNIPEEFSVSISKARSYIENIFIKNVQSAIIFTAPGFKIFTPAIIEFIRCWEDSPQKRVSYITLHDREKKELEKITIIPIARRNFIFSFWPWQEEAARFIHDDIGVVKSFFHEELNQEIFYSELKSYVTQLKVNQDVTLRVALLRETGLSMPHMGIITNIPATQKPMEELLKLYLSRWPNSQEAYQDLLKKIERLTYAPLMRGKLREEAISRGGKDYSLGLGVREPWVAIESLLVQLNDFCQTYFFPTGYEKLNLATMKERFYRLPGRIKVQKNSLFIQLIPPENYPYLKDLNYACRRLNESDVKDESGRKLWVTIQT